MITEEMLTAAALELSDTMNKYMPSPEDCVHTFSLRFHRKMRKVIRKAEHPVLYQFARKAAAIVLIVFLGFMTLIAISPSVRADVVGWIKEKYETFYEYYFVHDNFELGQEAIYGVDPIPEGYKIHFSECHEGYGRIIYKNKGNQTIKLTYSKNLSVTKLYLDEEDMCATEINLENRKIDVYTTNSEGTDCSLVVYFKDDELLLFLAGNVEETILIEFIKNFKEIII